MMQLKSKKIGILSFRSTETGHINTPGPYVAYFSRFGNIVPIFALDDQIHDDLDLLVLIGGADVYPQRYGAKPDIMTQNPNVELEWFDMYMLPKYIDANIPIFGICRGFQTLNVHFGGTLSQHIVQKTSTTSRGEKVDKITATEQGLKYLLDNYIIDSKRYNKMNLFEVNSLHHQGIYDYNMGAITPLLINAEYDNIEAFSVPDKFIYAVQWHPEECFDSFSSKTIKKLLFKNE